ncbi:hypothetical protein H5410_027376 [Solanum commersonii]|uniref:Uncharacterized protein n=1 Tax=Solanum commersonii TaxID=4109 RepID=A0A9J5Z375_SOLCO|nr:hypothetical protein H5410_027376 [Solanum commersonii]
MQVRAQQIFIIKCNAHSHEEEHYACFHPYVCPYFPINNCFCSLKIKKVFSRLVMGLSAKAQGVFKRGSHTHKVGHKRGYGTRAHLLRLNLMSTHFLGHHSSGGFSFATSLSGKPKTHRWLYCAAADCLAILVEIADTLGDPPFGQLIAFSVLPLASSHSGSLGGTVLLRRTDRQLLLSSPFDPFPSRLRVLERRAIHIVLETRLVELGDPQDSICCSFQPYLLRFAPKCPCFH